MARNTGQIRPNAMGGHCNSVGFRDQITMWIPVEAAAHRGCGLLLKKTSATLAVVK